MKRDPDYISWREIQPDGNIIVKRPGKRIR
jgi:hypothetical protein